MKFSCPILYCNIYYNKICSNKKFSIFTGIYRTMRYTISTGVTTAVLYKNKYVIICPTSQHNNHE